jgi:hypothetical protein
MRVAMMQPSFMPWQGYFELIFRAERFIILDDFQFSVQSYHQRNRLFVNQGQVDWYTVPVHKSNSFQAPLDETRINESSPWRKKYWKRIEQNYSKAPFYADLAPAIKEWLLTPAPTLAAQNIELILLVCRLMGIKREVRFSSAYPSSSERSLRVVELLRWCEADRYLCARGSFPYMKDDGVFPVPGIEVAFQNFVPKPYCQVGSPQEFIPFLSVLDALMNVGPDATLQLIAAGTENWSSWEEMLEHVAQQ